MLFVEKSLVQIPWIYKSVTGPESVTLGAGCVTDDVVVMDILSMEAAFPSSERSEILLIPLRWRIVLYFLSNLNERTIIEWAHNKWC